ncbi:uncharacterized protein ACNS7B_003350 [Menidia menidia]
MKPQGFPPRTRRRRRVAPRAQPDADGECRCRLPALAPGPPVRRVALACLLSFLALLGAVGSDLGAGLQRLHSAQDALRQLDSCRTHALISLMGRLQAARHRLARGEGGAGGEGPGGEGSGGEGGTGSVEPVGQEAEPMGQEAGPMGAELEGVEPEGAEPEGAEPEGSVGQKAGPEGLKAEPVGVEPSEKGAGPVGLGEGPVGQEAGSEWEEAGPIGQEAGPMGQEAGPMGQEAGSEWEEAGPMGMEWLCGGSGGLDSGGAEPCKEDLAELCQEARRHLAPPPMAPPLYGGRCWALTRAIGALLASWGRPEDLLRRARQHAAWADALAARLLAELTELNLQRRCCAGAAPPPPRRRWARLQAHLGAARALSSRLEVCWAEGAGPQGNASQGPAPFDLEQWWLAGNLRALAGAQRCVLKRGAAALRAAVSGGRSELGRRIVLLTLACLIYPAALLSFKEMASWIQQHARRLRQRTLELRRQRQLAEDLLHQMLPRTVARQLRKQRHVEAESYDRVTIFFSDIVGFTSISASCSPLQVVEMLNNLYMCFDTRIDSYDVYKVRGHAHRPRPHPATPPPTPSYPLLPHRTPSCPCPSPSYPVLSPPTPSYPLLSPSYPVLDPLPHPIPLLPRPSPPYPILPPSYPHPTPSYPHPTPSYPLLPPSYPILPPSYPPPTHSYPHPTPSYPLLPPPTPSYPILSPSYPILSPSYPILPHLTPS